MTETPENTSRYRIEVAEDPVAGYGCPCCTGDGGARGFVYEGDDPLAVYFAEAGGMASKPVVLIGIVIGKWEGDTSKSDRNCFAFACSKEGSKVEREPTIPYLLAYPEFPGLGDKVQPEEAKEHPRYGQAREVLEAIFDQDYRLLHYRPDDAPRKSRFAAS